MIFTKTWLHNFCMYVHTTSVHLYIINSTLYIISIAQTSVYHVDNHKNDYLYSTAICTSALICRYCIIIDTKTI